MYYRSAIVSTYPYAVGNHHKLFNTPSAHLVRHHDTPARTINGHDNYGKSTYEGNEGTKSLRFSLGHQTVPLAGNHDA